MQSFDIDRTAPAVGRDAITIAAPADRVWQHLADIGNWPSWNEAVSTVEIRGPVRPGTAFVWKAGGLRIRSRLEVVEPCSTIAWTGEAPLIRARHVYRLTEWDGRTRVESEESFSGPFARILPGLARRSIESALAQGLAALKRACEAPARVHGTRTGSTPLQRSA